MTLSGPCFILSARKVAAFALIMGFLIVGYAQRMSAQSGMNCYPMDLREAVCTPSGLGIIDRAMNW